MSAVGSGGQPRDPVGYAVIDEVAATRRLLRQTWDSRLEEQLEAERGEITRCAATADAAEGIAAFSARRPPSFGPAAEPRGRAEADRLLATATDGKHDAVGDEQRGQHVPRVR